MKVITVAGTKKNLPGVTRKKTSARLTRRQGIFKAPGVYLKTKTIDGLKWAMAALHPCSESQTEAVAYPDDSHMDTHCTRMQRTVTMSPPGDVNCSAGGGASLDACSWNLMVVTTPFPEYPWFTCMTKGSDEPQPLDAYLKAGKTFKNGDASSCVEAECPNWNDWVFWSFPNFMNPGEFGNPNIDANDLRSKYTHLRVVGKGSTTYLNASKLNDGGRVIAGQYPCAARFVDTFDASSWNLPLEDIVEAVRQALCVPSTGSSIPKIREAAQHNHDVASEMLTHSHEVVGTIAHSHSLQVPAHAHSLKVEIPKHFHGANSVPSHSHSVKTADLEHTHGLNPHTHTLPPLGHKHKETGGGFTDISLNLDNMRTLPPDDDYVEGGYTKRPNWTNNTGKIYTDVAGQVGVYTGEAGGFTGEFQTTYDQAGTLLTNTSLNRPTSEYLQTSEASFPTLKTGPAVWTNQAPPDAADACVELEKKVGAKFGKLNLLKDKTSPDTPDWFISEPPTQENMLFYGDPKATTWPARHGCYQVLRLSDMTMQNLNTGYATFYDLGDHKKVDIDAMKYDKSLSLNTGGAGNWGITYYRNISMGTSVTAKCVQYTQGVVNPKGPFANLSVTKADPDPIACELVSNEMRRLPHAFYARYNDLSQILGNIFQVAKNIGSVVKGVATQLHGIPLIGDVADGITGILGGLGL